MSSDETIMRCKPFVCCLKANQKSFRCDYCFKSLSENRLKCDKCVKSFYCNEFCLKSDSSVHSIECNPNDDLNEIIGDLCRQKEVKDASDWIKFKDLDEFVTQTLILLKILFKLKTNSSEKQIQLINGQIVDFNSIIEPKCQQMRRIVDEEEEDEGMDDQNDEMIDEMMYNFGAWLSVVRKVIRLEFIANKLGSIDETLLERAFRISIRYTLYVLDSTFLLETGKAFYVEMCFVGHSCVPNCCPLFDDNNVLSLRALQPISDFSQLKYDFQIEMTGTVGHKDLKESLEMRNIECFCKKCMNPSLFSAKQWKQVSNANLKYGNWPTVEYCLAMSAPIEDAIISFVKIYGKYHPSITSLLLWKLRNDWLLINQKSNLISREEYI